MYVIVKDSQDKYKAVDFRFITQYCLHNKMVQRGWQGCTKLREGVEIFQESCGGRRLIKTWKDDAPEKYKIVRR